MQGRSLRTLFISTSLLLASQFAIAEEIDSSDERLKRIEQKIDKIVSSSEELTKNYISQPLGDRKNGIEFNFFRTLSWDSSNPSLSGTYSRFNTQNNTEIAFPFMWSSGKYDDNYADGLNSHPSGSLRSITLDAHFRQYLGHSIDGFYFSGFTRVTNLRGIKEINFGISNKSSSETKLGVGFGVGYRVVSNNGLYWGASISVGKYLIGESDIFESSENISTELDDGENILDVEFFKFGYAF